MAAKAEYAIRARVSGEVQGTGFRDAVVKRAGKEGVLGWVRNADDGSIEVHAEAPRAAMEGLTGFLGEGPLGAKVENVEIEEVKAEGHEQFAIRGVPAGVFVVQEHQATAHHFDLRLEVDGTMRSWAVPKGPSMDPAVKRMAIQVEDHEMEHNDFEGELGDGWVIVWDRGTYEPGAQRTRGGEKPQWLLIKRSDDEARRGSDVVAGQPGR